MTTRSPGNETLERDRTPNCVQQRRINDARRFPKRSPVTGATSPSVLLAATLLLLVTMCHGSSLLENGRNTEDPWRSSNGPAFLSPRFPEDWTHPFSIPDEPHHVPPEDLTLAGPPPNCTASETSLSQTTTTHNQLECFLWNLRVPIPEQSFTKDWITVSVRSMACTHFVLGGLRSSTRTDDEASLATLDLSVRNIAATCQGSYHTSGGLGGNVVATVSETAPPALQLSVGLQSTTEEPPRRPSSVHTLGCTTVLGCSAIQFSGSMSAKMIQAFSGRIGRHITTALQQDVCPLMTSTVDPILTAYLQQFNQLIQPYLEPPPAAPPAANDTNAQQQAENMELNGSSSIATIASQHNPSNASSTNLLDYPAVHGLLSFANDQLRDHLQTGWIPLPAPTAGSNNLTLSPACADSFRGISGWIVTALGKRPKLALPKALRHLVIPIPETVAGPNGTVSIDLSAGIAVQGLDTMDSVRILAPSGDLNAMDTKLSTQAGLFAELPVKLRIRWPAGEGALGTPPTLVESFSLRVNLTSIDLGPSSGVTVSGWETTSLLQVVDAVSRFATTGHSQDLACLVGTLSSVEVARNGTSLVRDLLLQSVKLSRSKTDPPEGSLEADLDKTINTVVGLVLAHYSDLWTDLVRGLADGPGRTMANEGIARWMHGHAGGSCPPARTLPSGRWVHTSRLTVLDGANRYLARPSTLAGLNEFLECLQESVQEAVVTPNGTADAAMAWDVGWILPVPGVLEKALEGLNDESGTNNADDNHHNNNTENDDDNATTRKRVTLSSLQVRNWDALQGLQVLRPSGDTGLVSSLVFGMDEHGRESALDSVGTETAKRKPKGPPEVTLVVDVEGYEVAGQFNLTVAGGLEARVEVDIDYDLNLLENLTVAHLLHEPHCALVPALQVVVANTTRVTLGNAFGARLDAVVGGGGRRISLSTADDPRFRTIRDDVVAWTQEFGRTLANYALEEWIERSVSGMCPGVAPSHRGSGGRRQPNDPPVDWSFRESSALWMLLGLVVVLQGGLVFVFPQRPNDDDDGVPTTEESHRADGDAPSAPLLSSYQELRSDAKQNTVGEEWDNEANDPQGILEDQLAEEDSGAPPKPSIFDSERVPEPVKYLVPVCIVGTLFLFLTSNLSVGASVDLSVAFGKHSVGVPGLFSFSLGKTVSEMYRAGIYPLLFLIICFSGIWPYLKLLLMLFSWMTPCADQHKQEQRLLMLDALGKYSLVDNYVLILFVVAFRFHLEISDNLGLDVYVSPVFGFFSFLIATCLSLVLGHAVLFFHRKTMGHAGGGDTECPTSKSLLLNHAFRVHGNNPNVRLSRFAQGCLLLLMLSTISILIWGFLQESYTFEIGGMAGMLLDDDVSRTSYSVLSLGAALPSSVEDPHSLSIMFLQGTFFFFTMVTPILCLALLIILMIVPLTLKSQQYILVAAEIANSWSAVEVFLLSILAALFQISTFASFMIGDKCDEINILARKIFGEEDADLVCFTVDASIESNCWYLLVGALSNFLLVSFCLGFAEIAVEEKMEDSCVTQESSSTSETVRPYQTVIQRFYETPLISCTLFASVSSPPTMDEYSVRLEDAIDDA